MKLRFRVWSGVTAKGKTQDKETSLEMTQEETFHEIKQEWDERKAQLETLWAGLCWLHSPASYCYSLLFFYCFNDRLTAGVLGPASRHRCQLLLNLCSRPAERRLTTPSRKNDINYKEQAVETMNYPYSEAQRDQTGLDVDEDGKWKDFLFPVH